MTTKTAHQIQASDGVADVYLFYPKSGGPWPAVIFYFDAAGVRPAMEKMAERLASLGYCVMLPNLYYRSGPQPEVEPGTHFKEGPARERMMKLYQSINAEKIMRDTAAYLDFLIAQPQVAGEGVGTVGYCMGGGYALSAAGTFPDRVAAAASFHGGRLATDQPDSPHLLAPKMRAEIYIGIAGIDPHFSPEEKERLRAALQNAGLTYTIDTYEGVRHGFAVSDHPAYDRDAAERHWKNLEELFGRAL
jgi:carboxymethylenebutenolidase